jgi:hypothetical protein
VASLLDPFNLLLGLVPGSFYNDLTTYSGDSPMLLRLLLITSALTTVSLVNAAFVSTASRTTGSDTLDPVAVCAPTPSDDNADDDKKDPPRRPRRTTRAFDA